MFRLIARLSAIAALLAVVGCDNNPNPLPYQKTREDGSPWVVFNWALTADPSSLDPQYAYDEQSHRVLEPIYDTLLQYHPLKTEPYELMPCMLTAMPKLETAADGKVSYFCQLKAGIFFHDDECFPGKKGREVVAKDVAYVFQRICDPAVESPFFGPLSDAVVGMAEAQAAATANNNKLDYDKHLVSGIELVDRYAFRIHLSRPYPQLKYWMGLQTLSPVAREAAEYYAGQKLPNGDVQENIHRFKTVGTGPFRLAEYVPRQRVRLVRVPGYKTTTFPTDGIPPEQQDYLGPLAGKALPFVDEVRMTIIKETPPMFILTRQGYLDRMAANKDAFASLLTSQRTLSPMFKDRGMFLEKDSDPSTFWISFNMEDPLVGGEKNKKLRQALSCAYDAGTYVETFMSGVAPVATQLLPPGFFGYDPKHVNPYGYNLEKAKKLLAEAGYPNGYDSNGKQLEISLNAATDNSDSRQRAEYDQNALQKLGIKVVISESDFPTLLRRKDTGQFQVGTSSGWGADYPDAENFYFLFYSKNVPPNGKNETRYSNPEFDKLFEKMALMEDTPERLEIIGKMRDILEEDVAIIPIFNKQYYTVIQPWARRTHHNSMLEGGVKYVKIDAALRERAPVNWNNKPWWPLWCLGALLVVPIVYVLRWTRGQHA
jgi:oligopeptide transport system substrate-binding protein